MEVLTDHKIDGHGYMLLSYLCKSLVNWLYKFGVECNE